MKSGHLKLVPFNPSDYSLGSVLVKDHQTLLTEPSTIGAAISLLFQWPDYASVSIVALTGEILPVSLSYDEDERSPSEIWISVKNRTSIPILSDGDIIKIRFEVFRQCYEFESNLLCSKTEDGQPWDYIIDAPAKLVAYKMRRLPRVFIGASKNVMCTLLNAQQIQLCEGTILEMGMGSLRISSAADLSDPVSFVTLGNENVPAKVERRIGNDLVLSLVFDGPESIRKTFDFYKQFAFPDLVARSSIDPREMIGLYEKTEYFSKFDTPATMNDRKAALEQVWSSVRGIQHQFTADYVTAKDTELTGASSTTLCFIEGETQVWAFHQLCSVRDIATLEHSRQLYMWRAEYLAARPEPLKAVGWFSSHSKWLERIYVKFAFQKYKGELLHPVRVERKRMAKPQVEPNVETSQFNFGSFKRTILKHQSIIGGIEPSFLNASGILDSLVCIKNNPDVTEVTEAAICLAFHSTSQEPTIEFTFLDNGELSNTIPESERVTDVDRYFEIPKEGLVDFLACVEHSVAVTRRKLEAGETDAAS